MVNIEKECYVDKSKTKVLTDEQGVKYIRIYIPKTKMYINLYSNPDNDNGEEDMKKALKEIYLQQFNRY